MMLPKLKIIILIAVLVFTACRKEIDKFEKPDWLEGKLYTQLLTVPEVDSFAVCVAMAGYDTILDRSGSYTIFAPDNQAFRDYFAATPAYSSISDIPRNKILELVCVHIIQNPWSREQLKSLDINGWINERDPLNNEPFGYKRQTLLKDQNRAYWVKTELNIESIVDSVQGGERRVVYNPSRKYVPLFFDEYLSAARISGDDYEFFFDRPYEYGEIYYSNAKLYDEDYFAENGFIYRIDKLVKPLQNIEQLLENKDRDESYNDFLNTVYLFPSFRENLVETNKQEGASEGLEVETLYDLDYSTLLFDIHEELTGRSVINATNTIRYHYGILAPSDDALQDLIDNVVTSAGGYPHWPNWDNTPDNVKRIIVNSHMSQSPVYLSDLTSGFVNGENDSIAVDPASIIEKRYGSNATFYGLNKAIVPRAFSSVSGPIYLRPGFNTFMQAVEFSNVLSAIKRKSASYSLFAIEDTYLETDSSLYANPNPSNPRAVKVTSYDRAEERMVNRSRTEMMIQIFNQVGTSIPTGIPRKEFIPNLAGNYIIYNSEIHPETGGPTVSGGLESKFGYRGDSVIYLTPLVIDEPTDNGVTYQVEGWFYYPTLNLYNLIKARFPSFYEMMEEAGFVEDLFGRFTFTTEGESYTVFAPTDSAINSFNYDTLAQDALQELIKTHFVRGDLIFTDGKKPSMEYETLSVDETSTEFNTVYTTLDIRPSIDLISLHDKAGNVIVKITENDSTTNQMATLNISPSSDVENYITNAVVHAIDTLLINY